MSDAIADELTGIDLGDKRLNERSKRILTDLAAKPEASINAACDGWGDTLAAYRFFDNDAVSPEEILKPHVAATVGRMKEHPVVLIAQDTTELDYTAHPQRDARCLNRDYRFGLYAHASLAVTPDRLSLGVVGLHFFDRAAETLGQSAERRTLPIEEKESVRWLDGYTLACQLAAAVPDTQVVSVADREGDIYDIYLAAQSHPGPRAEYVIRSRVDRSTLERNPTAGPNAFCKVRSEVAASKLLAMRTIDLNETSKRPARLANVEIRAVTVRVKPPHERSGLQPVTFNVVLVEEVGGPGDDTDISWLLITSLPIDTLAAVLLVVEYYGARWAVEIYFRTLKTGCRVEEIQLDKVARLKSCLAMYAIVAWRVQYLTYLNRTCPTLTCTAVFTTNEWTSLWLIVAKKALPPKPPELAEMMRLVARLGGYNNRAGEAPFGPQTIWVGLRRMADFVLARQAFVK